MMMNTILHLIGFIGVFILLIVIIHLSYKKLKEEE